jgi:YbbR domain-containing protein
MLDAEPRSLTISLLEIAEMELKIAPQLVGRLPDDLKLVGVEVKPRSVKVMAPVGEPKKGEKIELTTTPIYLESITEETIIFCKIIAPPNLQPVDKRWPDAEVAIKVRSKK